MWKRENETTPPAATPASTPSASPRRDPEAPPARPIEPAAAPAAAPTAPGGRALIGPATTVRGEISGEEDLLVEGRVEGKISLRQNAVTVGAKGRVAAEVHARAVLIDGEVEGDLTAEEQIVVRKSGRVYGDLTAPRVTIEDGARFKGSIDMDPKRASSPAPAPVPSTQRSSSSGKGGDPIAASLAAVKSSANG